MEETKSMKLIFLSGGGPPDRPGEWENLPISDGSRSALFHIFFPSHSFNRVDGITACFQEESLE